MKKYTSLIAFGRFCRVYAVLGGILTFLAVIFSPYLFIDNPSYGGLEIIILLTMATILTSIHFLFFSAIPDFINLLVRLERNTRGISELNDTLKVQTPLQPIQTTQNQETSSKPTF